MESAIGHGTRAALVLPISDRASLDAPQDKTPVAVTPVQEQRPLEPPKQGISRVLLVDDHVMFRQGLRSMLETYGDVEIVGEASNGEEAVTASGEMRPTIVVIGISTDVPRVDGIKATRDIKARYPHVIVIGLTVNPDNQPEGLMKKAGADAFLSKEAAVEHLDPAIHETGR